MKSYGSSCLYRTKCHGDLHHEKSLLPHQPQQAKVIHMACIYDSDSSLVASTRLASVVTLASARMTPCEYSTPNTALMLVAIRFACFSDQKRKSSAEGWESVLMLSTSRLLGLNTDAGRRDGSASRHRLMMWSKHDRTPTKSKDDGFDTAECGALVNRATGHNSAAYTYHISRKGPQPP